MEDKEQPISSGHKTLLIGIALVGLMALGALVLLWPQSSCDGIFQQTAPKVEANLEIIKSQGAVVVSREKIQELSDSAQKVGLHLKTCCSVLDGGKLDAGEFQQCIAMAADYDRQLAIVAQQVVEVVEAKEQGAAELVQRKVVDIKKAINTVTQDEAIFARKVSTLSKPDPKSEPTPKPKAAGNASFESGVFEFKWPGGDCWAIYRADKRVSSHCGSARQALQAGSYTIKPSKPVFHPFDVSITNSAAVKVEKGGTFQFKWPGGDCWTIYRGAKRVASHCGSSKQALQAGVYSIRPSKPVFDAFDITIRAGEKVSVPSE